MNKDKGMPEPGVQYRLTGGTGTPSISNGNTWEESKIEKPITKLVQGDIVEHSGGYNCTRTEFYIIQTFNATGKKAYIRQLAQKQVSGDWMNGEVAPDIEGEYMGEKRGGSELHEVMVKGNDWNGVQMLRGRINHTVVPKDGSEGWTNTGPIENFRKWSGKPIWNNCD